MRVHLLEVLGRAADLEVVDVLQREGVVGAAKAAGERCAEAHGAYRRWRFGGRERSVHPAVGGRLAARRAGFHVVLRIEMRAG
ncbi:MAG: hypothetical protein WDO18_09930 [Acidobacteriota bacterium]